MPFQSSDDFLVQLKELFRTDLKLVLHSKDYIQGIIFGVCAAPEIPMPENWLLWAFDQHGQLASTEQADKIAEILMGLLQQQLIDMRSEAALFPAQYQLPETTSSDNLPCKTSEWLSGLLGAHSKLEPVWQGCWDQVELKAPGKLVKYQKDLKHCLLMFSTFANLPMAVEHAKKVNNHKLLENLPKVFNSIPDALATYVQLSGELAQYLPDQFETFEKKV